MCVDRFTIGLDLDGVCADYVGAFRKFVAKDAGLPLEELGEVTTWSFIGSWPIIQRTEDFLSFQERAAASHLFRHMPAMPGVIAALDSLVGMGALVRIVTHRFVIPGQEAVVAADTIHWLQEQGLPYTDLCFTEHKHQVAANVYIDDAPHNVELLRRHGKDVIIFDQPYNRHVPGPRARCWEEAHELVVARMGLLSAPTGEQAFI